MKVSKKKKYLDMAKQIKDRLLLAEWYKKNNRCPNTQTIIINVI